MTLETRHVSTFLSGDTVKYFRLRSILDRIQGSGLEMISVAELSEGSLSPLSGTSPNQEER